MLVNRVKHHSFVTLHYRLRCNGRECINTFVARPATLTIGTGALTPTLENLLLGLEEGAHQTFTLPPGTAFGQHHPDKLRWVSQHLLQTLRTDDNTQGIYQVGDVVQFPTSSHSCAATVLQIAQNGVLFDFNHPLAGQSAEFEVQVLGVL